MALDQIVCLQAKSVKNDVLSCKCKKSIVVTIKQFSTVMLGDTTRKASHVSLHVEVKCCAGRRDRMANC